MARKRYSTEQIIGLTGSGGSPRTGSGDCTICRASASRSSAINGYCESLNLKLRDELLNGEVFTTLREAQVMIENWRRHYNAICPRSSSAIGRQPQKRSSTSTDADRRRGTVAARNQHKHQAHRWLKPCLVTRRPSGVCLRY